jgi:hypothetical protein
VPGGFDAAHHFCRSFQSAQLVRLNSPVIIILALRAKKLAVVVKKTKLAGWTKRPTGQPYVTFVVTYATGDACITGDSSEPKAKLYASPLT